MSNKQLNYSNHPFLSAEFHSAEIHSPPWLRWGAFIFHTSKYSELLSIASDEPPYAERGMHKRKVDPPPIAIGAETEGSDNLEFFNFH